jgi:amidase
MVDGEAVPYLHAMQWTGRITIADLPATAIPTVGSSRACPSACRRRDLGWRTRTPLRFAQLAGRELGGYQVPATLSA